MSSHCCLLKQGSYFIKKYIDKFFLKYFSQIVLIVSLFIFLSIFVKSLTFDSTILSFDFIMGDVLKSGRQGGILSVLMSTLIVLFIAVCPTIILSLCAGFYLFRLKKFNRKIYRIIDFFLYVLLSMPSIVFGLYGNVFFVHYLKFGHSLLSGGATLFCMLLPFTIKMTQISFENINDEVYEAVDALGINTFNIFSKVLFPLVIIDVLIGFLIALGRAIAETAALLFTSGFVTRLPNSILDSGRVISVHIYELVMNVPGGNLMAQRNVTVLILAVLFINFLVGLMIKKFRRVRYE